MQRLNSGSVAQIQRVLQCLSLSLSLQFDHLEKETLVEGKDASVAKLAPMDFASNSECEPNFSPSSEVSLRSHSSFLSLSFFRSNGNFTFCLFRSLEFILHIIRNTEHTHEHNDSMHSSFAFYLYHHQSQV